ncbi:MAG: glycosyltransferase [Acidobacteriaceae bacterium]|nr:glycosyltransferase [Acidobacteriaceae bacterium]
MPEADLIRERLDCQAVGAGRLPLDPGDTIQMLGERQNGNPKFRHMDCELTIVIVTKGRPELRHAIESVLNQDYAGPLFLLILADELAGLPVDAGVHANTVIETYTVRSGRLRDCLDPYRRIARLRNIACRLVRTRFVCFLDDDNLWERDHVSTLMRLIRRTQLLAVHSWRRLIDQTGNPVTPDRYLWLPPGAESDRLFDLYCRHGVMDSGGPVVRDRTSLVVGDTDYGMVDMGEWLFDSSLFSMIQFDESGAGGPDELHGGEDDKLLRDLRSLSIGAACSDSPSLLYRLGGFSNAKWR